MARRAFMIWFKAPAADATTAEAKYGIRINFQSRAGYPGPMRGRIRSATIQVDSI